MCPRHGYHIFIGAGDLVTKLEQARKIGKSEIRQQPQANGFYHQFLQKKKTIFLHLPRHNFHLEVLRWTRPKNWKNPCSRSCDNLWTTWNGPEPCNTSGVEVSVLSWGHPQLSSKKKKWQWISIENILVTWGSPLWLEKPPHFHVELLYFLQLHTLKPGHLVINRNDITGTCKWTFIPPNMKYINGSEKESWCFPTERERESLSMSTSS